jgi:hypothetical protein
VYTWKTIFQFTLLLFAVKFAVTCFFLFWHILMVESLESLISLSFAPTSLTPGSKQSPHSPPGAPTHSYPLFFHLTLVSKWWPFVRHLKVQHSYLTQFCLHQLDPRFKLILSLAARCSNTHFLAILSFGINC